MTTVASFELGDPAAKMAGAPKSRDPAAALVPMAAVLRKLRRVMG